MEMIHLMIAIDWEYDQAFAALLFEKAHDAGFSVLVVTPDLLQGLIHEASEGNVCAEILIDRASDTSPQFLQLQEVLRKKGTRVYDPIEQMQWASDKATMHLEFIQAGLHTPYTIILPPHEEVDNQTLSVGDLARLGRPFIIKPANTTGGGIGVVEGAESLHDVLKARLSYQDDKYLIQEKIIPLILEHRRFWFRGFYVFGKPFVAWWDDQTHLYALLSEEDIQRYQLDPLFSIMIKIAAICKLHFFSSEIVVKPSGEFVVVDYVNESCDMRMQSTHLDGVPDSLVNSIANQIIRSILTKKLII